MVEESLWLGLSKMRAEGSQWLFGKAREAGTGTGTES